MAYVLGVIDSFTQGKPVHRRAKEAVDKKAREIKRQTQPAVSRIHGMNDVRQFHT